MRDQFRQRYISQKMFFDYAKSLDLFVNHSNKRILEFLEKHGVLNPVARIVFPGAIVRRWHKDRYPSANVPQPIEGDTAEFDAATELYKEIFLGRWKSSLVYGECTHPIDNLKPKYKSFIRTHFEPSKFVPWDEHRAIIEINNGKEVGDGGSKVWTFYHYWHVFILASFLRSGVTILYDIHDKELFLGFCQPQINELDINKLYTIINFEARHELTRIVRNAKLFDAVAWYEAYCHNALQSRAKDRDRKTGRLSDKSSREYNARCRAIAKEVLDRFQLAAKDVLSFVKFQCELWCTAKSRSPEKIVEEYARNIASTIDLYRDVTKKDGDQVVAEVGRVGVYHQPILKVIFPNWIDEQRDLAQASLENWILPSLSSLTSPFLATEQDIPEFCEWLELNGLIQFYWHFRRLVDLGVAHDSVTHSATAIEVVSCSNSAEILANQILEQRGNGVRGKTLAPKVHEIVESHSHTLRCDLMKFRHLTVTNKNTLRRRLAHIDRVKGGGKEVFVLRAFLKLIVIRNEGSHLGLQSFDRENLYSLLESLVIASFLLWKIR